MKHLFILSFAILSAFVGRSQVTVTILEDNPELLTPFRLRLPLVSFQPASYNLSGYSANFGFDWKPIGKLLIGADYSLALLDRLYPETQSDLEYPSTSFLVSQKADAKSNYFSFDIAYNLTTKRTVQDIAVNLGRRGNVQYYTRVPGTVYSSVGLRAGFKKGVTWYHFGETIIQYGNIDNSNFSEGLTDCSTYLSYTQLRFGLSYEKITNLHIYAEGYGNGSDAGIVQYHLDLLPAISAEVDDVYYVERNINTGDPNGYTYFPVLINDYNDKMKFGFELGVKFIPTMGHIGYFANLGRVPGFKGGPNGYLELGAAISIGKKIKPTNTTGKTFESQSRK